MHTVIRSHSVPPLTLSGSRVKREVGSSRCHSEPPVPVRLQVLLKELLRLIVQDKGQVSSASLTPFLSTLKGSLQIHKLVARAVETFLVFWAGLSFSIILGVTTPAEEENHQSERSWSGSVHLWSWTLFRLSGSILFLKSNDVSSSDRDGFLDGCRALYVAIILGVKQSLAVQWKGLKAHCQQPDCSSVSITAELHNLHSEISLTVRPDVTPVTVSLILFRLVQVKTHV